MHVLQKTRLCQECWCHSHNPVNTPLWINVFLVLAQHLRRWLNIKTLLVQRLQGRVSMKQHSYLETNTNRTRQNSSYVITTIRLIYVWNLLLLNPLTAGAAYIRVFIFIIFYYISPFKHVKDQMWHQSARYKNSWPPFCQIWIIFTHLKLWIASARHNFKWVKIQIE